MDKKVWHCHVHHGTIWCQCILYYHDVGGRSTECLLYCRGKRYSLQIPRYYLPPTLFSATKSPVQALQYVLNNSQYNFVKTPEGRAAIMLSTGKGLVWADGCLLSYRNHFSYSSSFNRDAPFASEKDHESRVFAQRTSRVSSPLPLHCAESTKTLFSRS